VAPNTVTFMIVSSLVLALRPLAAGAGQRLVSPPLALAGDQDLAERAVGEQAEGLLRSV
jgi:hypothetical protein